MEALALSLLVPNGQRETTVFCLLFLVSKPNEEFGDGLERGIQCQLPGPRLERRCYLVCTVCLVLLRGSFSIPLDRRRGPFKDTVPS